MMTLIHPLLAANAFQFAIEKATPEGKTTIAVLLVLSMFSWTIIITKFRQLYIARRTGRKFFEAYNATRDPLDIKKRGVEFDGAPAYQLYERGAEELAYHLKNNPVEVKAAVVHSRGDSLDGGGVVEVAPGGCFGQQQMITDEADQDRHILGRKAHPASHVADDVHSRVGVVPGEPLPDVMKEGTHQEEVRALHIRRQRGCLMPWLPLAS